MIRYIILKILPKNLLSRIIGYFAERKLPACFVRLWIKIFQKIYKIDMKEVETASYKNFNEFFTRSLKKEARPIDGNPQSIVSPVDGVIGCFGKIENNTLFQAKGISYSLQHLVVNQEYAALFQNGLYITLYLSPRHYHRIHCPVAGSLEELFYIPGTLYPVNSFAVKNIPALFTLNERLISLIETPQAGKVAVIKVGATVVGKIKVVYDTLESNQGKKNVVSKKYQGISLEKGQELGRFQMGSTVILLFSNPQIAFSGLETGKEVRFGEKIATWAMENLL
ncbi:MAG: phosphatidylserine decarboxylase [Candidatus Brocadiae bacterium]|nr:phosphatidylserine decarboxylase [Candidatus Brocadiia bacterium]